MSVPVSRRQLLVAASVAPLAACTSGSERPAVVDPDDALREAAVQRERALMAAYDAAPPSPLHAALRAEHAEHLAALGGRETTPAPAAVAGALPALERQAAAAHAADALKASGPLAAVLASLAASEASHPVALA